MFRYNVKLVFLDELQHLPNILFSERYLFVIHHKARHTHHFIPILQILKITLLVLLMMKEIKDAVAYWAVFRYNYHYCYKLHWYQFI